MKRVGSTSNNNSPVAGWKLQDQNYLRMHDNAEAGPEWQLLTEADLEEEDKEQRDYFCAICKSRLDFLKDTETIWRCNECMQYYDPSIQDVPIKDLNESKVRTYTELSHVAYDTLDLHLASGNVTRDLDEWTGTVTISGIDSILF